jgi:hypothetical protein
MIYYNISLAYDRSMVSLQIARLLGLRKGGGQMKACYCAVFLGVLAGAFASAAQAGMSVNGMSVNGMSVNGLSLNGATSAKMGLKAVILQDGSMVSLR